MTALLSLNQYTNKNFELLTSQLYTEAYLVVHLVAGEEH